DDCLGASRLSALAEPALAEAWRPLEEILRGARTKLVLCLDAIDESDAKEVSRALLASLGSASLEISLRGEAAACFALPAALGELGRSLDCVILGGVHSHCDPRAMARLSASGRLFANDNLDAILAGEAAAFVVLTHEAFAKQHRLTPLGRIDGVGS